jgi:HAD superfamily hydrolase (TIGR01490 family)
VTRTAALFDMDRTLVRKDTAGLYTRYRRDVGEASLRDLVRVAWWMLEYTAGIIDAPRVAERALRDFKGVLEKQLIDSCEQWFKDYVLEHVLEAARGAVKRHRENGDDVAIVTGATKYAAMPLAKELGIDFVVCTELEVDGEGRLTGQIVPPLCYGEGKIERAQRLASARGFELEQATFYSDSVTDLPLMKHVAHPVAVNPDFRLKRVAKKNGWEIQKW